MINCRGMDEAPLMDTAEGIVLFHPHIPARAKENVNKVLSGRWIGQGPLVDEFEKRFGSLFGSEHHKALAVGSGTDALHLSYILAGIKEGDEVITPVFTCTATNIPLLYIKANVVFADVDPKTMNINTKHVRQLVSEKTKAIVCVHYGGLPCDMEELHNIAREYNIPIIEDAAHAVGATYKGKKIGSISPYTMYSFQAIKHITTGDGGLLMLPEEQYEKAKRLRWFGIDRTAKQMGVWENDITEIGYKYQMTDIAASMALAALEELDETLSYRRKLFNIYEKNLTNIPGLTFVGGGYTDREHAAWMCTIQVEKRKDLSRKLRENKIESAQVHYRNDRYSIFGGRQEGKYPHMDAIEDKYLVLPLHTKVHEQDVYKICNVIKSGW
ncbi:MAG: DegT/DnrJ/EryC1/StrS family aminotransferase [Cytophagaceae bacterium]|nr:DegT/DnrJ/EryC1/StrS family aminotransferase [Cytophagaceae bacterium]MDW8456817.1 DegT/DnrJ/EryC1/StrS family aminotransferase [Cytophagaceae bacterium]